MTEIPGMKQLLSKIDNLAGLKGAKRGLKAGAVHVKGFMSKYAPATVANSSSNPSGRWYQRGYGPRWRRKDGSLGGRKTSETLGRKWTSEERNGGLTQVIGNNVSYGPWVQSSEQVGGKGPQARFHQAHGWKTDEQVIDEEGDRVLEFVAHEIERELGA